VLRKWENGTLENILEELKVELQRQKEIKLNLMLGPVMR
jgi:hypothetical protein